MRRFILLPLLFAPLLFARPAHAQVTVNLRALDSLPSLPPLARPPAKRLARPRAAPARPHEAGVPPPAPGRTVGPASTVATTPPPPAAPPPAPALPATPPPPPTFAGLAPRSTPAAPLPAPLTLVFPPGKASLTAAETASITALVRASPQTDATTFSVLAYAAGSPQNPSAARRLALARALAVHDALRAAGVPGSRIFLRAVGPPTGSGTPDRALLRVSAAAGNTP